MSASTFQVKINGLKELQFALKRYPAIAEPILQRAMDGTAAVFAKHTQKENPVPYKTGILLQSFRHKTGRLMARWFPTAKYASFVSSGTKPHIIEPKTARVLAWKTGGTGKYVTSKSGKKTYRRGSASMHFATRVNHPGTKANPYMERIKEAAGSDVNRLFGQALDQVTHQIAKQ